MTSATRTGNIKRTKRRLLSVINNYVHVYRDADELAHPRTCWCSKLHYGGYFQSRPISSSSPWIDCLTAWDLSLAMLCHNVQNALRTFPPLFAALRYKGEAFWTVPSNKPCAPGYMRTIARTQTCALSFTSVWKSLDFSSKIGDVPRHLQCKRYRQRSSPPQSATGLSQQSCRGT